MRNIYPLPESNNTPSEYANKIGLWYASQRSSEYKKKYGQYLTPLKVAIFMAKLFTPIEGTIRIADPGAGTGVLGCATVEYLTTSSNRLREIELTVYEIDKEIIPYLTQSLDYTRRWLKERGIRFLYEIRSDDFILANAKALNNVPSLFPEDNNINEFDYIVSNPPYFKLPKSDNRVKVTTHVVNGQPNIYALFMAVAAAILKPKGELVFITPRSYAAGPYFKLFRERFFSMVNPSYIHLFGSRKDAFDKDAVLQENIILKAYKDNKHDKKAKVTVSFSQGLKDLDECVKKEVPLEDIIDFESKNKVLRIPITDKEDEIIELVHKWKYNLHKLGMNISTGPVVPFRAKNYISENKSNGNNYVPLLWMQSIKPMIVKWPADCRKPQLIEDSEKTRKLLVPNRNYILLRRFSAKEENRRLVAAPYLSNISDSDKLGIENHLNYIYRPKGILSLEETFGLSTLLNSKLLDMYFRTSNGNTQVSATELRDMPLPPLETIKNIGQEILSKKIENGQIDKLIEKAIVHGA